MSLKRATVRNLGAVASAQLILRLLSIVRNIFLARWLQPVDFGLYSLASAFVTASKRVENFGVEAALVQRKECPPGFWISGLVFRLFSASSCFVLLLAVAPAIAGFYELERLTPVMRLLAATLLLGLPGFLGRVHLTRALRFGPISVVNGICGFLGILFTLLLAYKGYGVWSLVGGGILTEGVSALLFIFAAKVSFAWKELSFEKMRELARFGRPLFGATIISFLVTHLDDLIVGKLLGATWLGFYSVAFSWANLPVSGFVNLVGKVMFPTVASIQENIERVRRGYLEAVRFTMMVVAPISLGLLALTPEFIRLILGEKWLPATTAMRILCVYALIRGIGGIGGSVRKGLGRPDIFFKLGLLFLAIMLLGIFPLTWEWGITGTAISVLIAALISNIAVYFYNKKLLQLSAGAVFQASWVPLLLAAAIAALMFFLQPFFHFFVVVFIGGTSYAFLLIAFCGKELKGLWKKALAPKPSPREEEDGKLP